MTTVCHAVNRFESRREKNRAKGGPCLSPLASRQQPFAFLSRAKNLLDQICRPKPQHSQNLKPTRLDRRSPKDVIYHGSNRWWCYVRAVRSTQKPKRTKKSVEKKVDKKDGVESSLKTHIQITLDTKHMVPKSKFRSCKRFPLGLFRS